MKDFSEGWRHFRTSWAHYIRMAEKWPYLQQEMYNCESVVWKLVLRGKSFAKRLIAFLLEGVAFLAVMPQQNSSEIVLSRIRSLCAPESFNTADIQS